MFGSNDPVSAGLMLWAGIGVVVAAAFLLYGFDKVDPGAHDAYAVRPLLIPGLVLLWPVVIWRWLSLAKGGQ
ncbi:hypothetical protein ABID08_006717 [Rhizobium binae]|uniref:DUF2842 domain-containing protein n=1 Tax=Rhizobium binae TaxID=1138190 RepID=A0ABV2MS82_9HYPH|nr:hypothetical protein [Rhizobium binae]MBX4994800.1 hypothetical protein [Rhizobium binae]NKL52657.1 hypothetical protein [Rhizobium leguminosarum bv. viciae]QSY85329.1 hypothetical protein J2J99_25190 [Rhizobium binae]